MRPVRESPETPRNRRYIVRDVRPGTTFTDQVEILNLTESSLELRLDAVDAQINADGAFAPAGPGQAQAVGSWIGLQRETLTVPALSSEVVDVRISVPSTAEPGDHLAAIAVQRAQPRVGEGNVQVIERVAVRVYLTVEAPAGGELTRDFRIRSFQWRGTTTDVRFTVEVENVGDRLIEPLGRVTIQRDGQTVLLRELPVIGGIPASESRTFDIPMEGELAGGSYEAHILLTTIDEELAREARVTFEAAPELESSPDEDVERGIVGRLLPVLGSLLFLVSLALIILVGIPLLRRGRDDGDDDDDEAGGTKQLTATASRDS